MSAPGQETPVEGAPTSTPEPAAATGTPEWAPVMDRVGELADTVGELQSGFQIFLQSQQPPAEPEPDPWAALFGEPEQPTDEYGNPVQAAPQQPALDPQALQTAFQAAIQQHNAPLTQELQQYRIERADQQLGQMIPALANTPENQENRSRAFEMVTRSLQTYPEAIANALAADPNYIAAQWKAAEADRLAQGQAPAGGQVPSLEAAGGALPGGNSEPINPVDQAYASRPPGIAKGFL